MLRWRSPIKRCRRIATAVKDKQPTSWVSSLTIIKNLFKKVRHWVTLSSVFFGGSCKVIFTEFIFMPKNSINFVGWRTIFFIFIKNCRLSRWYSNVSCASIISSFENEIIKVPFTDVMRHTFSLLNKEMGIFIVFVIIPLSTNKA